jgi:hypothetical protein
MTEESAEEAPMLSATYNLSISAVRADALFASALQRSDEPSAGQVRQAIAAAIRVFGDLGCAARVAQAYGEHPETAVTRMCWARMSVAGAFGGSEPGPGTCPQAQPVCTSRAARATTNRTHMNPGELLTAANAVV